MTEQSKIQLSVLCLADESFRKVFPDYQAVISNCISFVNKQTADLPFALNHETKQWQTEKLSKSFSVYLDDLARNKNNKDFVFGYTNNICSLKFVGVANATKGVLCASNYFPVKIPKLYEFGLSKLTLHEFGHLFGLKDKFGIEFSIMDNVFGIATSRFTDEQKDKISNWVSEYHYNKYGHSL